MRTKHFFVLPITTFVALACLACSPPAQQRDSATIAPDPQDVATVDSIITALYDVISGDAGVARDWDRFRSLLHRDARLISVDFDEKGEPRASTMTPADYIARAGPWLEQNGFFEREIHRVEERFGHIVHAFSTYESRRRADDPEPFVRGINSIQLLHDGVRWWILSVYWEAERPSDQTIPPEYLPAAR